MPPRHGKSLTVSETFPAWFLGKFPQKSVIATSYGAELALEFGRKVRNNVACPMHRRIFPDSKISPDSAAANRFALTARGNYRAVGAGGSLTGKGAHLLVIDDPIKEPSEAFSAVQRGNLQLWYTSVAYSRLEPDAAVVLVLTRWHQDDLAGWLLREHAAEGWQVVSFPALANEGDLLGRAEGEALWPERYNREYLLGVRAQQGSTLFTSQYQQEPTLAEGAIFKRSWWHYYTAEMVPKRFSRVILSLDTAQKTGAQNDYSAGVVIGATGNSYFVLDLWRERVEYPDLKKRVVGLCAKWRPSLVLIEDKASGISLIQTLKKETGLPIKGIPVDRDKISRASGVTGHIESGLVYLPKDADWLDDFLDELSGFPASAHDDITDAFVHGLNFLYNGNIDVRAYARILGDPAEYNAARDRAVELHKEMVTAEIEERQLSEASVPCCVCEKPVGASKITDGNGPGGAPRYKHPYNCLADVEYDSFGAVVPKGSPNIVDRLMAGLPIPRVKAA